MLTYITETRPVCSVSALSKSPTKTSPLGFTPKNVAPKSDFITFSVLQHNGLQTLLTALRTESCSTAEETMWGLPFASRYGRSPANTRLFASLPPEVKMIWSGSQPINLATRCLASATALAARLPSPYIAPAFPYSSLRYGNIASKTSG